MGFAGIIPAYILAIRELFPASEAYWRIPAFLLCSGTGMAAGGWLAGALYDHFGTYAPAFAAGVAANAVNSRSSARWCSGRDYRIGWAEPANGQEQTMLHSARVILIAGLLGAGAHPAAAYFELSGVFIADERCQAYDSIRRQTNPGGVLTVSGQSYNVRALNREDGDYVHVDVPGANPRARWVSITCGDLFRGPDPADPDDRAPTAFTPFFDTDDRANDPTPRPPSLTAFDQAMLQVCGNWGSRPAASAFRARLDDSALAADVERIYRMLDGSILGDRREARQFKDELAAVWFGEDGFRHVFCGVPSEQTIGGLHFAGRYLQMQEQGWGGLAAQCNAAEIVPPVYTFGVRFRTPSGRVRTVCPKGYALNLDAGDILIEATRAFKLMLPRSSGKAMCLHKVAAPNVQPYLAVLVMKSDAVRTFYPDAAPTCDRGRPAETCLCER